MREQMETDQIRAGASRAESSTVGECTRSSVRWRSVEWRRVRIDLGSVGQSRAEKGRVEQTWGGVAHSSRVAKGGVELGRRILQGMSRRGVE